MITYLSNNIQAMKEWYETTNDASLNTPENKAKRPIYTAIRAYQNLLSLDCLCLAFRRA
jgi:hypothetical protein